MMRLMVLLGSLNGIILGLIALDGPTVRTYSVLMGPELSQVRDFLGSEFQAYKWCLYVVSLVVSSIAGAFAALDEVSSKLKVLFSAITVLAMTPCALFAAFVGKDDEFSSAGVIVFPLAIGLGFLWSFLISTAWSAVWSFRLRNRQ